jgi:acyl-coenzyme A synthetase/AMP-(fatty) acid ligase
MSFAPLAALMAGARAPHSVVAVHDGQPLTWGWMQARSAGLAARLSRAGVRRAGLWCADGHDLLIGLLAAARANCTVVLPPADQPDLLAELADAWDVAVGDGPGMMAVGDGDGEDFAATIHDVAVEFFTSGSTARPKRIERRLSQLEAEVAALHARWPGDGWGRHHATVPHQHAYGIIFKLLWPLLCGRTFVSASHPFWEGVAAQMQAGDVLVTSPAHLTRLGGLEAMARPALMLSAGAPLPLAAADEARRLFGIVPTEIFGSTETGAMASRSALAGVPWAPLPGAVVAADDDGLLSLVAPWVDGRHQGADAVVVEADGQFHLHGRADRVVKIEGKRVGLAAVEAALCAQPCVADAAVAVLPGARTQLAAAVVLSGQGQAMLAQLGPFRLGRHLRAALASRLEPLARPRLWRFVAELPGNVMGKRTEAAIAALFSNQGVSS